MKRRLYLIMLLSLWFSLSTVQSVHASVLKWIKVGKIYHKVLDSGDQGQDAGGWWGHHVFYYYDSFNGTNIQSRGWQLGTSNWTDENGTVWNYKISGAGVGGVDEQNNTMPVPQEEGIMLRKYVRNKPPSIAVDGFRLDEPFPMTGDEVDPDKIPGTADQMIESWIRTSMGITIHQRVLTWSQPHHDDYIIFDWTFTNTGNVDLDDDVELPNQTLNDVYFLRCNDFRPGGYWNGQWLSCYGEFPEDSLRMDYSYPCWNSGTSYDNFGLPDRKIGFIRNPIYVGEATIHADKSTSDHSDDPTQPQMTGHHSVEWKWVKMPSNLTGPDDWALLYQTMRDGWEPFDGVAEMEGTYPGTHHKPRMDEMEDYWYPQQFGYQWHGASYHSIGPYTIGPGESIRIVWATVIGSISPEIGWEKGRDWLNGNCTWDGPDNLPPPAPRVYEHYDFFDDNDINKDHWVATGKDSLFKNAWNAQWNVRHNYNAPIPPPPPSIEVTSLPDKVLIEWGNESESASDFAGYRVYRATGSPYYSEGGGVVVGKWEPIFECEGSATHSYEDKSAKRGNAYYYYVAAFDDGIENEPGVMGEKESLESGEYLNQTTRPAFLTRAPGKELSEIRVVPNPYSVEAKELQYPGEPDKIMFLNLPPICTIKIYNESGDLINTLQHTDGSGDEAWADPSGQYYQVTSSTQIPVSGLYFAHIETPDGRSTTLKLLIVR